MLSEYGCMRQKTALCVYYLPVGHARRRFSASAEPPDHIFFDDLN
jgi:hypothetical protein